MIYVWPPSELTVEELNTIVAARAADHRGRRAWRRSCSSARQRDAATGELTEIAVRISFDAGRRRRS